MKPNDKAIEAALLATTDSCPPSEIKNALDAAYAAQFNSEEYAELVKRFRSPAMIFYEYEADQGAILRQAADAIEAVLAKMDALKDALEAEQSTCIKVGNELAVALLERDALAARLAPVDDEGLVEIVTREIAFAQGSAESPSTLRRGQAREVIAAIHPHIKAAERERCAKIAANQYERMKNKRYVSVDWMHGYLSAARDIHSAIRRGE